MGRTCHVTPTVRRFFPCPCQATGGRAGLTFTRLDLLSNLVSCSTHKHAQKTVKIERMVTEMGRDKQWVVVSTPPRGGRRVQGGVWLLPTYHPP